MPQDTVLRLMRESGMRFLPGQRDRLLAHVRPVLDEIERRAGRLTLDSIEEPRRWLQQYATDVRPQAHLWWTIRARAARGGDARSVRLAFEPFDGRLLVMEIQGGA